MNLIQERVSKTGKYTWISCTRINSIMELKVFSTWEIHCGKWSKVISFFSSSIQGVYFPITGLIKFRVKTALLIQPNALIATQIPHTYIYICIFFTLYFLSLLFFFLFILLQSRTHHHLYCIDIEYMVMTTTFSSSPEPAANSVQCTLMSISCQEIHIHRSMTVSDEIGTRLSTNPKIKFFVTVLFSIFLVNFFLHKNLNNDA